MYSNYCIFPRVEKYIQNSEQYCKYESEFIVYCEEHEPLSQRKQSTVTEESWSVGLLQNY